MRRNGLMLVTFKVHVVRVGCVLVFVIGHVGFTLWIHMLVACWRMLAFHVGSIWLRVFSVGFVLVVR